VHYLVIGLLGYQLSGEEMSLPRRVSGARKKTLRFINAWNGQDCYSAQEKITRPFIDT